MRGDWGQWRGGFREGKAHGSGGGIGGAGGQGEAEAVLKRVEADGLPEAAEGDVEGVEIRGGVVEAVQAGGQEVQVVQEGLLPVEMGPVFLEGQLPLQVMGVAA